MTDRMTPALYRRIVALGFEPGSEDPVSWLVGLAESLSLSLDACAQAARIAPGSTGMEIVNAIIAARNAQIDELSRLRGVVVDCWLSCTGAVSTAQGGPGEDNVGRRVAELRADYERQARRIRELEAALHRLATIAAEVQEGGFARPEQHAALDAAIVRAEALLS